MLQPPDNLENLHCQAASSDPDIVHLHEARKEKDWPNFKEVMQKEADNHINNKNFKMMSWATTPKGTSALPGVWQMRHKRKINTREVHKWKARLNLDGSRMLKGLHCDHTCAPVVGWSAVRLMLMLTLAWG